LGCIVPSCEAVRVVPAQNRERWAYSVPRKSALKFRGSRSFRGFRLKSRGRSHNSPSLWRSRHEFAAIPGADLTRPSNWRCHPNGFALALLWLGFCGRIGSPIYPFLVSPPDFSTSLAGLATSQEAAQAVVGAGYLISAPVAEYFGNLTLSNVDHVGSRSGGRADQSPGVCVIGQPSRP
jgi:hypothetical protein